MLSKTLTKNNFIENNEGIWVATVLATTHGLGAGVTICKMQKLGDDGEYHNAMSAFSVDTNGNIEIYVDEPAPYRITILKTDTRNI